MTDELPETVRYVFLLTNRSPNTQSFFFFQHPSAYPGTLTPVFCNSLSCHQLRGAGSGAQLRFEIEHRVYAGVQTRTDPPVVGQFSGTTTVLRDVDVTTAESDTDNRCEMLLDPLGLGEPTSDASVQRGAFRIATPRFNPATDHYNGGLGVAATTGFQLSNFVEVQPLRNLDVAPTALFYVQVGTYEAGEVIVFDSVSKGAARCDATAGVGFFDIQYQADGTWTVNGTSSPGATQLLED